MKFPLWGWIVVFALFMAWGVAVVSGVECNADLSQGGDSCDFLTGSLLILNGTYNINMNGSSIGAIQIRGSNKVLDCNGTTIYGNYTLDSNLVGIYAGDRKNVTIRNCIIKGYYSGILISTGTNTTIVNSTLDSNLYHGIRFANTNGVRGYYNSVNDSTFLNNGHFGLMFVRNYNSLSYNNLIINSSDTDSASGIYINQGEDNTVEFNNLFNNSNGVYLESSGDNLAVSNNVIRFNNITFTNATITGSGNGVSLDNSSFNSVFNNRYYLVKNGVRITGFATGNNVSNEIILNSSQYGVYLSSADNNRFDNITVTNSIRGDLRSASDLKIADKNYFDISNYKLTLYSIDTMELMLGNASFYNLTNALIYNTNGSIYGSSDISSNDGNVNITLTPNNASYVLDNFNLTEGVSRTNSPLWFSYSSDTEKHIASNLTDTIDATILFNVYSCDSIGNINYVSELGTTKTYQRGSYTCSDNVVTLNLDSIDSATSSNVLTIEYACSSFTMVGYRLIIIIGALILVIFLVYNIKTDGITLGKLLVLFITIIVAVVLWQASGQIAGGSCGVIS